MKLFQAKIKIVLKMHKIIHSAIKKYQIISLKRVSSLERRLKRSLKDPKHRKIIVII